MGILGSMSSHVFEGEEEEEEGVEEEGGRGKGEEGEEGEGVDGGASCFVSFCFILCFGVVKMNIHCWGWEGVG